MTSYIKERIKNINRKPSLLVGEGGGGAVGRGKREEKPKNDFDLCTQTCPYRLAGLALPSVFGGSLQLRKKEL